MEFNEKLQQLRIGKNLTQQQLAEQLYVSRTAISKMGKRTKAILTLSHSNVFPVFFL